jgi:hypothetical protein
MLVLFLGLLAEGRLFLPPYRDMEDLGSKAPSPKISRENRIQ